MYFKPKNPNSKTYQFAKKYSPLAIKNLLNGIHAFWFDLKTRGFSKKSYLFILKMSRFWESPLLTTDIDLEPIDVIIPCTQKDIATLPGTIDKLRKHLKQPIQKIHLIVPGNQKNEFEKLSGIDNLHFDESVSPVVRSDLKYNVNGIDRSGWLLQQFIKLNSDTISTTENFLIYDSDTHMVKETTYLAGGKTVFYASDEYHLPYFKVILKLFPLLKLFNASFVAHGMLFNRTILQNLKKELATPEKKWFEMIIEQCDFSNISCFSEYELYGNYFYSRHPEQFTHRYWCNLSLERKCLMEDRALPHPDWVRTISFHDHFVSNKRAK